MNYSLPILFYHNRREDLGQTKSTTINYFKNLKTLFDNITRSYIYEDQQFPKGYDLLPCVNTVTKIKLLCHKLGLVYKRTTKQQPGELFIRKTEEASTLPEYRDVVASLQTIKDTVPKNIEALEVKFSNSPTVNVRSEKNSSTAQKQVCVLRVLYSPEQN